MGKYIGIIIQNQNEKILFYEDSYYIKVSIDENDDINSKISKVLKNIVEQDIFKIIKVYDYKPNPKLVALNIGSDSDLPMYLVEVYIYHDEYDFFDKDELFDLLPNSWDKDFYEENLVRYESILINLRSLIYNTILAISLLLSEIRFKHPLSEKFFFPILIIILCIYFILPKLALPHLSKYLLNSKFDMKFLTIINYIVFFIIVICTVRLFI